MSRFRTVACGVFALVAILPAVHKGEARAGEPALHVVVVVVDGLNPDEVTAVTPTLSEVRSAGTWFEDSRSVLVAETIPNHVAMMTGVLPGRSGIVANSLITQADQDEGADASDPQLFDSGVETLFTSFHSRCPVVQTASVLSKEYLFGIFSTGGNQQAADFHWKPSPLIPESDHTPDVFTANAFLGWLDEIDPAQPSFSFVNLGDVDRMGHVDFAGGLTEGALPAQRRAVLEHTDAEVGRIVSALEDRGVWDQTVFIVASDHGMDWSRPNQFVETAKVLKDAGFTRGAQESGADYEIAHNGGADLVYVHDDAQVPAVVGALENVANPGIAAVMSGHELATLGIDHRNVGDVVVFAADGWRMADPTGNENAIAGNHGHGPTQHNVLMVGGGSPTLATGSVAGPDDALLVSPRGRVGNLSITPTVATLFGLASPNAPFDAPALDAAFTGGKVPTGTTCAAAGNIATSVGSGGGAEVKGTVAAAPGGGAEVTPATGGAVAGGAVAGALLVLGALARRRFSRG